MVLNALSLALGSPSFGGGLFQAGQQAGQQGMMSGYNESVKAAQEEEQRKLAMQNKGLLSAYGLGQNPGNSNPTQALGAIQEGTGVDAAKAIEMMQAGQQQAASTEEAAQKRRVAEQKAGITRSIAADLQARGQSSLAKYVASAGDMSQLPTELQKQVFKRLGMTDEEALKAVSTEGKLATDMGFVPGSAAFQQKVTDLSSAVPAEGQTADRFTALSKALKTTVDLSKHEKIRNAIIANESSGMSGSEYLQESTLTDLFDSNQRAIAAISMFRGSESLYRRLRNVVSRGFTGEAIEVTAEDRDALIYAAYRQQMDTVGQKVDSMAPILKFNETEASNFKTAFGVSPQAEEWASRFEERFKKPTGEPKPDIQSLKGQGYVEKVDANGNRAMVGPNNEIVPL